MKETAHFRDMLRERSISREWVECVVKSPDRIEEHDDGTRHFIKRIAEQGDRCLRVVVSVIENPNRFVTVFFDRRLRGEL